MRERERERERGARDLYSPKLYSVLSSKGDLENNNNNNKEYFLWERFIVYNHK